MGFLNSIRHHNIPLSNQSYTLLRPLNSLRFSTQIVSLQFTISIVKALKQSYTHDSLIKLLIYLYSIIYIWSNINILTTLDLTWNLAINISNTVNHFRNGFPQSSYFQFWNIEQFPNYNQTISVMPQNYKGA